MTRKRICLIIGACFGLGLGLSSTMSVAHACKCATVENWNLSLVGVEGDGEAAVEAPLWDGEAQLSGAGEDPGTRLHAGELMLELERVQ